MKYYRCSVSWKMVGGCEVLANSLEDAQNKILHLMGLNDFNGEYCSDSFEIDELKESEQKIEEDDPLISRVREKIAANKVLEAVLLIRKNTGMSLADAKKFIDKLR